MAEARSNAARSAPQRSAPHRSSARPATGFQPRRVKSRAPLSRIRWDRASRVALVAVLVLIGYLWVSGISSLLRSHAQADRGLAQVRALAAVHHRLLAEERALHQRATILGVARTLGMVKKGEQAFILTK